LNLQKTKNLKQIL